MVPLHQLPAATAAALEQLVSMHGTGRASVKLQLREAAAEALRANQSEDLDVFIRLGRVVRRVVLGSDTAGRPRPEALSRSRTAGPLGCRVERGPCGPRGIVPPGASPMRRPVRWRSLRLAI